MTFFFVSGTSCCVMVFFLHLCYGNYHLHDIKLPHQLNQFTDVEKVINKLTLHNVFNYSIILIEGTINPISLLHVVITLSIMKTASQLWRILANC